MKTKLTKERVKDMAIGVAIGTGATIATIIISGTGKKISKDAFKAGARMVGYRAGVSNIGGHSIETNVDKFGSINEFDNYIDELYEEYLEEE